MSEKWLLGQLYPDLADEIASTYGVGAHPLILKPNDGSDGFPHVVRNIAFMAHHSGKLDAARALWEAIHNRHPDDVALEIISDYLRTLGVQDDYLPGARFAKASDQPA